MRVSVSVSKRKCNQEIRHGLSTICEQRRGQKSPHIPAQSLCVRRRCALSLALFVPHVAFLLQLHPLNKAPQSLCPGCMRWVAAHHIPQLTLRLPQLASSRQHSRQCDAQPLIVGKPTQAILTLTLCLPQAAVGHQNLYHHQPAERGVGALPDDHTR